MCNDKVGVWTGLARPVCYYILAYRMIMYICCDEICVAGGVNEYNGVTHTGLCFEYYVLTYISYDEYFKTLYFMSVDTVSYDE